MRIIERYPLGLRMFLGKGMYTLLTPIRFILSVAYGIYLDFSRTGKKERVGGPAGSFKVISIGNLEAGGSGKTPVTLAIASHLMGSGKKVAVVTRGFGSVAEKKGMPVAIVPEGKTVYEYNGKWIPSTDLEKQISCRDGKLTGIEVTGDEAYIYMSRRIPVIIDPNRARGIEAAGQLFKPDYILLDDAFRHTELSVDLNILLLDARRPFGNHRLMPAGTLRERPKAVERADLVIFTRADNRSIPHDARVLTDGKQILFARHEESGLVDSTGRSVSQGILKSMEVILFSGIARPESFEALITGAGIEPAVSIRFEDHHKYSKADVDMVKRSSPGKHAYITTEKDIHKVKMFFDDDDLILALRIEAVIPGIAVVSEG